jgi:hypothetical protein
MFWPAGYKDFAPTEHGCGTQISKLKAEDSDLGCEVGRLENRQIMHR